MLRRSSLETQPRLRTPLKLPVRHSFKHFTQIFLLKIGCTAKLVSSITTSANKLFANSPPPISQISVPTPSFKVGEKPFAFTLAQIPLGNAFIDDAV
jgi:hypothetical protein